MLKCLHACNINTHTHTIIMYNIIITNWRKNYLKVVRGAELCSVSYDVDIPQTVGIFLLYLHSII